MTSDAPRCHDCGNHEKCEAQQQAEAEVAEARAMDDLIAFLRARLDEDEERATTVQDFYGFVADAGSYRSPESEFVSHLDPARVLRDVEAKRAVMDLCEGADELDMSSPYDQGPWMAEQILRRLASAWSDHPDYDAERWAP